MYSKKIYFIVFTIFLLSTTVYSEQNNGKERKTIFGRENTIQSSPTKKQKIITEENNIVSTPDIGYRIRKILIGENGNNYFTLTLKTSKPQDEISYKERVFINSYNIYTEKLIAEKYIGGTGYLMGPSKMWSYYNHAPLNDFSNFDLGNFLKKQNLKYAFPSIEYSVDCWRIKKKGLVLKVKNKKSKTIFNTEDLKKKLSVNNLKNVKILASFETRSYLFLQFKIDFQSRYNNDYYQTIIPIDKYKLTTH